MLDKIWFPLSLTLWIVTISSIFVLCSGVTIAYVFARREFRGKGLLELLITLPLVLPPTVIGYILVILVGRNGFLGQLIFDVMGRGIMFTWQAAVIAAYTVSLPLMVYTAKAAIEAVDREIEYAAYILGKSELETALQITLPLAKKRSTCRADTQFCQGHWRIRSNPHAGRKYSGKNEHYVCFNIQRISGRK